MSRKLEAALYYAEKLKWSVIPCKPDKKPYIAWDRYSMEIASSDQIRQWWGKWPDANIGIITGKLSGICAVDIDNDTGANEIIKYIPSDTITPKQTTPKGGFHLIFKYPEDTTIGNNARAIPGCDFRGEKGYILASPSSNGNGKNYVWINKPTSITPAELPKEYIDAVTTIKREVPVIVEGMFEDGRRDEDLFHVANCLTKGNMPPAEIYQVLRRLIVSWGESPEDKWINAKIKSALERADKRDRNITDEVKDFISGTEGYFSNEEIYRSLCFNDVKDKASVRKALERFVKEKYIERQGLKDGIYRRIDEDAPLIDFREAQVETIPISYPFGEHFLINTYPGNLITIAGTVNSGKTAYLLNLVARNMVGFKIKYFSSEMGKDEFSVRLHKFDNVPFKDWNFEARERSSNFADVIKPDGKQTIWIIDFLELLEDFWKVGLMMKAIYDKLVGTKDIAVVALQKAPGSEVGRGGAFGLEKPRVALAMERGKIKIIKAKNWKTDRNPNGLFKEFKLRNGCQIVEETEWEEDEGKLFKH